MRQIALRRNMSLSSGMSLSSVHRSPSIDASGRARFQWVAALDLPRGTQTQLPRF
jgi:hypothetical protein